ncbi:4Fe-4S binding protein [Candidatus Woesearchaeota archaeon]|nr:4Fe-4S binding protein [Candidatus Woesearchaeota archaeon]
MQNLKKWKELEDAGNILDKGNNEENDVSGWRSFRPIHIREKCIDCMICWSVCPDNAVISGDGKFIKFDYTKCKGCLICLNECPVNAIRSEKEK